VLDSLLKVSIDFRLAKARSCLSAARTLLSTDAYADSVNRSYYCIYHSIRAILVIGGFSSKTHSGNIGEFRRMYIKTGVFPKEFSDIIGNAFDIRNDSDYEDFYVVTKDEAVSQTENADIFLSAVEAYVLTLMSKLEAKE
jgi:uncharacterized protein (UPF0332 family)